MSDLSAAAAAMGLPESLVERSAEARAAETGASVDEIIAAWAGGGDVTATAPADEAAPAAAAEPDAGPEPESETVAPETPEITIEIPAATEPTAAPPPTPAGPYKPPILIGAADKPTRVLAGVFGLFVVVLLLGLVGPAIQTTNPGIRTSEIEFSAGAQEGRDIYLTMGCAACHTQMVRPVVADVGLGAVTLNDSNQVLGTRRFGPDLSNVGARASVEGMEALIRGAAEHPAHNLSSENMASLLAYLAESRTAESDDE